MPTVDIYKVVFSSVFGLTASEQEELKEEAHGDLIDGQLLYQLSCLPCVKTQDVCKLPQALHKHDRDGWKMTAFSDKCAF